MIYKTDNIEQAIRSMASRNKYSLAFEFAWCRSRVRTRYNLISDVPSVLLLSWDGNRESVVRKWRHNGGLMIYRHMARFDNMPESDAVLFTEMPLMYKQFAKFQDRAKKEIIIYRPPDWSMHETSVNAKFPLSDAYRKTTQAMKSMIGKHDNLTRNQELCLSACGHDKDECAVFSTEQIEGASGLMFGQFKAMWKGKFTLRGHYDFYDLYKPMIPPDEPDLLDIYQALERERSIGGGLRALRFGKPSDGKIKFFEKGLKLLVQLRSVAKYDRVHIVRAGWQEMDEEITDAIAGVRRRSFERLRNMVDAAPFYPLEIVS